MKGLQGEGEAKGLMTTAVINTVLQRCILVDIVRFKLENTKAKNADMSQAVRMLTIHALQGGRLLLKQPQAGLQPTLMAG